MRKNLTLALQGARNATVKTWFIAVVLKLDGVDDAFVKLSNGAVLVFGDTPSLVILFLSNDIAKLGLF